jgi:xanthine dehydrogenase YagT iron-sulfur-binding subunit
MENEYFEDDLPEVRSDESRRDFLKKVGVIGVGAVALEFLEIENVSAEVPDYVSSPPADAVSMKLNVNGAEKTVQIDTRSSLLDTLRERLDLTGSKKGCDHGQCGACTVIIDGKRQLSCLTLAIMCDGKKITTIEGLANGDQLHPVQQAFLDHDGFQCGYCTPGQICSAVAMLNEAKNGDVSVVTENLTAKSAGLKLSDDEIRERMSGNICRCGAYPNIVAAIKEVQGKK